MWVKKFFPWINILRGCVGRQIYFCMNQIFLRGSKIFCVGQNSSVGQILFCVGQLFLLEEITLLYYN